jgi:tRNA(adenine34) deaminase
MTEGHYERKFTAAEYDLVFMRLALTAAYRGAEIGEVPIGACIVDEEGQVIGATSNRTITENDPTGHAEIRVLRRAAELRQNYRLAGMTVYTTIEPCVMCAGALVNARIKRLVFGAHDVRFGAVETLFRLCDDERLNHRIEIVPGVLADECRELMQKFFRARR